MIAELQTFACLPGNMSEAQRLGALNVILGQTGSCLTIRVKIVFGKHTSLRLPQLLGVQPCGWGLVVSTGGGPPIINSYLISPCSSVLLACCCTGSGDSRVLRGAEAADSASLLYLGLLSQCAP